MTIQERTQELLKRAQERLSIRNGRGVPLATKPGSNNHTLVEILAEELDALDKRIAALELRSSNVKQWR